MLLNRATYSWDSAKSCKPNYGVRIQFNSGDDRVDVLLCFECRILAVYHNDKSGGGEDFDNANPALIAVVKRLFPDDREIQNLK